MEDSYILDETQIGQGECNLNVKLRNVGSRIVSVLRLRLLDGRYVIRIYGVEDNPKGPWKRAPAFGNKPSGIFGKEWFAGGGYMGKRGALFMVRRSLPCADTMEEAIRLSLIVKRMADGAASPEKSGKEWKRRIGRACIPAFNEADVLAIRWQHELESRILAANLSGLREGGSYYKDALGVFGAHGISSDIYEMLLEDAEKAAFSPENTYLLRTCPYMKEKRITFHGKGYDSLEAMCFGTIQKNHL